MIARILLFLFLGTLGTGIAIADAANDILNPTILSEPARTGETIDGIVRVRVENEFWYIVILSVVMVASLVVVLYALRHRQDHTAKDIVNAAGLILVIFGTIMLVLVVQTSEQLTAAIGLLGAVAGYLFRSAKESGPRETA